MNYFIIHGTNGSSKENWFPWLEETLTNQGKQVFNLDFRAPINQSYENWEKVLNQYSNHINNQTVFICHSIGCSFLIKYCITNNVKIGKAIFVSGCNNYMSFSEFDAINKTMFVENISPFKNMVDEVVCYYSIDDPYIPKFVLESFANKLSAKKYVYVNAGHFNEKAGYFSFEDILESI